MKLEALSDEELMQALQAGNQDAFTTLYNRYHSALLNYVRGQLVRDRDYAEEVVQESFLRVNKHKATFNPGQLFRPWLYTITDRLTQNAKRDCVRRHTVVSPDTDFDDARLESDETSRETHCLLTTTSAADQKNSPESLREDSWKQELLEMLPQYVKELPRDLRRVVQFVMTNGASGRRAAAILGVKQSTFSKRMIKACNLVRERVESGDLPDNGCTMEDIHEGTIRDLIDALPQEECDAVNRVVFMESGSEADLRVVAGVLGKLLGAGVSETVLV